MNSKAVLGCLLGTAIGDALGLPAEGLSPDQQKRLFGSVDRHYLLIGHGMISDDTEHTFLTAMAWQTAQGDADLFIRVLAKHLKYWFLLLPPGVGLATARSCLRLLFGVPPSRSGVASAGNGATMRAAILGVLITDPMQLQDYVLKSARITHSDPRAIWGAWVVALVAQRFSFGQTTFSDVLSQAQVSIPLQASAVLESLIDVQNSLLQGETSQAFAKRICGNKGVTGYVLHTVPVCLHVVYSFFDDYELALKTILECAGDSDSTAAIVGGIVGARVGKAGIPKVWLAGLLEGAVWSEQFVLALENQAKVPSRFWLWQWLRNLGLLLVVLAHGFWRLARGTL
ncbi:MAG: ADP-ribosyl-[dinitrogen reductase] glycohydrolase [Deinococcota bacterium]|jgi:ADP-ribosyl-[dinitrogen reductase] hydrolase